MSADLLASSYSSADVWAGEPERWDGFESGLSLSVRTFSPRFAPSAAPVSITAELISPPSPAYGLDPHARSRIGRVGPKA